MQLKLRTQWMVLTDLTQLVWSGKLIEQKKLFSLKHREQKERKIQKSERNKKDLVKSSEFCKWTKKKSEKIWYIWTN